MSRLISVTITAKIDDDVDAASVADVIFNTAMVDEFCEELDCNIELLDAEVTLNVEAE